ncbi:patatin-like phospholipase family protein [Marilutibacter chinensis]|uniref:Patatin-like phospholipase family protein n=1 Tax=Marilutibacter chinensis TaxID=2912247 RepID=A0ABS9HTJ0_9GAMM|nr:patatin-like phospholipase family protein [Lysobacter chinensis]MCF7221524.1 patatin-like phospholipase family protein [Lysobacter chinensis]
MMAADPPRIRSHEHVALVLGAGGARGLAQIGVIEALLARGLKIVSVAGSSAGALVGGLYAAGQLEIYRDWLLGLNRAQMLRLLDPALGRPALFEGDRLIATLRELTGSPRIEDLPIDYTAVAVDLVRQREVWLREGDLWDAVRASIAIPGVFTPHRLHGRELVDGGLLAPLPIAASRLSDAQRLIAVDMHSWPERPPGAPARQEGEELHESPTDVPSGGAWRRRFDRWLHRNAGAAADRHDGGDAAALIDVPGRMGFGELMARSLDTMQAQIARVQLALDPPELVIRIPRDACQFYEFWRAAELIELGRSEAGKALDAAGY